LTKSLTGNTPGALLPLLRVALIIGVVIPFAYFGMQLLAAPFYPGYNFMTNAASDLGASTFAYGQWFSAGILLFGVLLLVAAVGIGVALHQRQTNVLLTAFVVLTIAACGVASLWAGAYPLPDPAHGGPPWLTFGMILTPLALMVALWKQARLRLVLLACVLLIVALIPLVSGALGVDTRAYSGLMQRLLALATFGAISLAAYGLLNKDNA
jgi:hypothetical membrane protein